MESLQNLASQLGARLKERKETIAVSESSTGGLISACLLAVPGASAYFMGGGVIYTLQSRSELLGITDEEMQGLRSASEPYAKLCARRIREKLSTTWGLAETGASGPSGNRYGDAPGHSCIALAGPVSKVITIETGDNDREANMWAFTRAALELARTTTA